MKLDKIAFARLVQYLAQCNFDGDIESLDQLVNIDMPEPPMMNAETLHVLMALMQEGTRKIDAIRQHRMMTGYGLKDSKDIVEKYWPVSAPRSAKDVMAAMRDAVDDPHSMMARFHKSDRDYFIDFINSFDTK